MCLDLPEILGLERRERGNSKMGGLGVQSSSSSRRSRPENPSPHVHPRHRLAHGFQTCLQHHNPVLKQILVNENKLLCLKEGEDFLHPTEPLYLPPPGPGLKESELAQGPQTG